MAGENTSTSLAALFQEVYSPELLNHVPDGALLVKELKFSGVEATSGGKFVQPVVLTREHGFTYAPNDNDAFTLNGASAMTIKRAEVIGTQLVGQGRLGYEAAARAAKGKAAFAEATELLVENMVESASYRLELMFLYGQSGIGAVQTGTAAVNTFRVSAATWAPAIWAGIEGAQISIVDSTGVTLRGTAYVGTVNMDENDAANVRTVTMYTTPPQQGTTAANMTLSIGDLVFLGNSAAAGVKNECLGIDKILTTSSGSLFNIPLTGAGSSPLFKGNTYDVGAGPLSVTHILKAAKRARDKGLKEPARLLCSPKSWMDLVNPTIDPKDASGARKIDQSYNSKKMEFGTESIMIHGPQGQNIEIVPHPYVKEGEAFLLPFKHLRRIGASDIDFKTPGMKAEEMFIHLQANAGYEFRCYANQAIFIDAPAKCVKLFNIA